MIRRPPRFTPLYSSAASDVYNRQVMTFAGPSAMFAYTALIQFLLALYGIYRLTQRDAPKESNDYVAMPRPRAALLILRSDPRNLLRRKKRNKA